MGSQDRWATIMKSMPRIYPLYCNTAFDKTALSKMLPFHLPPLTRRFSGYFGSQKGLKVSSNGCGSPRLLGAAHGSSP